MSNCNFSHSPKLVEMWKNSKAEILIDNLSLSSTLTRICTIQLIKDRKGHWSQPISTEQLFVVIRLKGYRRNLSARNRCSNRTEAARFEELNDSVAARFQRERKGEAERESIGSRGSSPYRTVADLGSVSGKCVQKRSIEGALSLAMRDRASENRMYN